MPIRFPAVTLVILVTRFAAAQSPPGASPAGSVKVVAFEVASVKPSRIDNSHPQGYRQPTSNIHGLSGNRLTESYTSLTEFIMQAYDVKDYQITGAPDWAGWRGDLFDVAAKAEGGTPPIAQVRLRLQALLADRFRLKLHRTMKALPVYELTLGKSGAKLKEVAAGAPPPDYDRRPLPPMRSSLEDLILMLSIRLDRPLINKSGLSAKIYDYPLDQIALARCDGPDQDKTDCVAAVLEHQLGLRLESRKAPIELLVIDHVEKPSPN